VQKQLAIASAMVMGPKISPQINLHPGHQAGHHLVWRHFGVENIPPKKSIQTELKKKGIFFSNLNQSNL
jgi:hypothetical protein